MNTLGDLGKAFIRETTEKNVFSEKPVDLETFLYDSEYLNLKSLRLSQPQFDFVDNCSRIFPEDGPIYKEGVLQVGQGAGKDTVSMILCLRLVYLLSCLESPQAHFNMGDASSIDIINVAPTAQSAKNIFFSGLTNYITESPLFNKFEEMSGQEIEVSSTILEFPKHIRLISGNSEHESWQGLNAILVVLDEIDAFKSDQEMMTDRGLRSKGADGVYETAVSLVASRFPQVGKVLSLSWPRFRGSFIQKRFAAGLNERTTYVPCKEGGVPYATWDFNPQRKRSDYDDEFEKKPILSAARYECNPPYAVDALFKDIEALCKCFDSYIDEYEEIQRMGNKDIRTLGDLDKKRKYYIHVDLSLTQANCALAIVHNEGGMVKVDKIQVWEPPANGEVDIEGVQKYILALKDLGHHIEMVTYDGFQSANSLQVLTKAGMIAERKSVDRSPAAYHTLKDLVSQDLIDGYFDAELIRELLSLDLLPNEKIAQRPGMLKDRADAIAGAVHNAIEDNLAHGVTSMGDMNQIMSASNNISDGESAVDILGRLTPQPNKQGIIVNYDRCVSCRKPNVMEYANSGGRAATIEEASKGWCLYCGARYNKSLEGIWDKKELVA